MKFKPFTKKYDFSDSSLVENFPDYMKSSMATWLREIVERTGEVVHNDWGNFNGLNKRLKNLLETHLRETFPWQWDEFLDYNWDESDRLSNVLALFLQNFADGQQAESLEDILARAGSAYSVEKTDKNASEYEQGVYDLVQRVPESIKRVALVQKTF